MVLLAALDLMRVQWCARCPHAVTHHHPGLWQSLAGIKPFVTTL